MGPVEVHPRKGFGAAKTGGGSLSCLEFCVSSMAAGFFLPRLDPRRSAHAGMALGEKSDIGDCREKLHPKFLNLGGLLVGKGLFLMVSLGAGSGDLVPSSGRIEEILFSLSKDHW